MLSLAHSSVPLPFNLSLRQAKNRAWVRGQNQAGYPFQITNHSHHVILLYPYYESRCPKTYVDPVLRLDTSNLLKCLKCDSNAGVNQTRTRPDLDPVYTVPYPHVSSHYSV